MGSDTDFSSRSGERYAHCGRKQECGVQKETGALAPSLAAQIWTVPNLISASRLLLVPVFAVLIAQHMDGWALFILAISGASDWLDGFLARRWNQQTRLGERLGPPGDGPSVRVRFLGW